ncbi:MAG: hypothetical protein ACRBF0_07295 [Calditrichia bacterium]
MKFLCILIFVISVPALAQVNNTAQTLSPGTFALSVAPVFIEAADDSDLQVYFFTDYGIRSGLDVSLRFGSGENIYIGGDLEWALHKSVPYISFSAGAHYQNGPGSDMTLLGTIPLNKNVEFFSGIDSDFEFRNDDIQNELWWAIGAEIVLRSRLIAILEADIPLSQAARTQAGLALKIYF